MHGDHDGQLTPKYYYQRKLYQTNGQKSFLKFYGFA